MDRTYKIFVDDTDYSSYLQVPFSINLRSDEAYNSASVILNRTNVKDPFKSYTKVRIVISDSDGFYKEYYFLVEGDDVREFYRFGVPYYSHNLTLIERTKLLDNIILPDFSLTNPATVTTYETFVGSTGSWKKIYGGISGNGMADVPGSSGWKAVSAETLAHLDGYKPMNGTYIYEGSNSAIIGNNQYSAFIYNGFKSNYYVSNIELDTTKTNNSYFDFFTPTCASNTYKILGFTWFDWNTVWIGGGHETVRTTERNLDTIVCYYYYDSSLEGYLNPGYDSRKKIIGYTLNDRSSGALKFSYTVDSSRFDTFINKARFKLKSNENVTIGCAIVMPGPWYDDIHAKMTGSTPVKDSLIFIADSAIRQQIINGNFKWTTISKWATPNNTEEEFYNSFSYKLFNNSNYTVTGSTPNADYWGDTFEINIHSIDTSANPNIISSGTGYKTIQNTLDKIVSMIDPSFGTFTAKNIPAILANAEVSERIYSEKTVSEILFDLARIIRAYPELDEDNDIKFVELIPQDNPLFLDSTEGSSYKSNSDNSVSSYVSNIKNVVSTPLDLSKIYSYWPSKNAFAYANGSSGDVTINPDATRITIPNTGGMYYLKQILVTNCIKYGTFEGYQGSVSLGPDTVIDITDFCYEKSYYDSLSRTSPEGGVSNFSKNNCIYWEKGRDYIALDELTAQTKTAIFGDNAPTSYKIQNALAEKIKILHGIPSFKTSNLSDNPTDYKYRIVYVDAVSMRTFTEKFNDDNELRIESNYNQQANTISGNDWGNVAQTDLLRRGNIDLSKTINVRRLSEIPSLGESYSEASLNYFADNINLSFENSYVSCNINYTKDYNKINEDISISKEYRQYEIYGEESVERYININRYCYATIDDENLVAGYISNIKYSKQFNRDPIPTPSIAVAVFKDKNMNPIKYKEVNDSGQLIDKTTSGIIIPLTTTISGNSVSFKGQMLDNFSGGFYPDRTSNLKYMPVLGGDNQSGSRRLYEARYVDDLGEAAYVSFYIINSAHENYVINTETYPVTNVIESTLAGYSLDFEQNIRIDKDNREKICFLYQMHFLTKDPSFKWHPGFLKYLFIDQADKDQLYKDSSGNVDTNNLGAKYYAYSYSVQDFRFAPQTAMIGTPISTYATSVYDQVNQSNLGSANSDIRSLALVYPKTQEIVYHIDTNIKNGDYVSVPRIYFTYFKTKQ